MNGGKPRSALSLYHQPNPGNLLRLHPLARTGQEVHNGYFEFHDAGKDTKIFKVANQIGDAKENN